MIPIEYFWGVLILVFGVIGAARGLAKELGVTTIMLLTLFILKFTWDRLETTLTNLVGSRLPSPAVEALYYTVPIIFVAIIAYEGFTLMFPVRDQGKLGKGLLGYMGGLLNGYLIIGSIWDVWAHANYLRPTVQLVKDPLSATHQTIIQYLPVTFINEYLLLLFGMLLLIAIILK